MYFHSNSFVWGENKDKTNLSLERKTIALVELASHNEVLSNYCKILHAANFDLYVFTNAFNYSQIKDISFELEWNLQAEEESIVHFINRQKDKLNQCDLIIFTTIEKDFAFFFTLEFRSPKLFVVHKLMMFIDPRKQFMFDTDRIQNFKDLVKICRYHLYREKARNLNFIKRFDGLIFPSFRLKQHLENNRWDAELPRSLVIDFAVHERLEYRTNESKVLKVTIPGIISEKSRDYQLVVDAFRRFDFSEPIELTLMGKPRGTYGRKILANLQALTGAFLKLKTYEYFVDQEEFDQTLKESDFLILPIAKHMKVSIFKERNGYTCVSGNINDMLRFGTPALLPAYYPLEKSYESLVSTYDNAEDLAIQLSEWIKQKHYLHKREQAKVELAIHSVERIAKRIKSSLLEFIENHSTP